MAYALKRKESVPRGVRRVACERLDKCMARLHTAVDDDLVTTVHGARTDLKKLRALLRLARPGLGKKIFNRENTLCRDAGRALAGPRDAVVFVQAMDKLAPQTHEVLDRATFEAVRDYFIAERAVQADPSNSDLLQAMRQVAGQVQPLRGRAANWSLKGNNFGVIGRGLERTYQRGQKAYDTAYKKLSDEDFHEWRKRVKDLWYQVRLLENAWPSVMGCTREQLKVLSDLLGEEHDLAMLKQAVTSRGEFGHTTVCTLDELIAERRARLQKEAKPIGSRIYADAPRIFTSRFKACFKAWHKNA
jgi:CHAD domain-containing protein